MNPKFTSLLRRLAALRRDRSGAVAAIVAMSMVSIFGMSALVVDIGGLYNAQHRLQASSDAAALAGAAGLGTDVATASLNAANFSALPGKANAVSTVTASMSMQLRCLSSIQNAPACDGATTYNAVAVQQRATVQFSFARLIGINSTMITATSTAVAVPSPLLSLDVMLVLDSTGSMNLNDPFCGKSKIACARDGAMSLVSQLVPAIDSVGLMTFPGLQSAADLNRMTGCDSSGNKNQIPQARYNNNPIYQVVGLTSKYQSITNHNGTTSTSDMQNALGAGTNGGGADLTGAIPAPVCTNTGIRAAGDTSYSDAIDQAQHILFSHNSGRQRVIVFLSDGGANSPSAVVHRNQCAAGITSARAAAATGTWLYTIAYAAPNAIDRPGEHNGCESDVDANGVETITACDTLRQMASAPEKFYSDNNGGPLLCNSSANPISGINSVFKDIARSFSHPGARLLPNATT